MGEFIASDSIFAATKRDQDLLEQFRDFRDAEGYEPARALMEMAFARYPGPAKEFRNDFQTTGFSARVWELAIFSWLDLAGVEVRVPTSAPDFLISNEAGTAAIEATTSNPPVSDAESTESALTRMRHAIEDGRDPFAPQDPFEARDEQVFQLAKIVRRKMLKQDAEGRHYWELPEVRERPFALAVMAHHARTALHFSVGSLASYLFGVEGHPSRRRDGSLDVVPELLESHELGQRSIPSGLFSTDDGRNLSAVIFSNTATTAQFLRIAIEQEIGKHQYPTFHAGLCFDPDPDASEPQEFAYEVEPGKKRETFATGITVIHNPWARLPVEAAVLPGATHLRLIVDGSIVNDGPPFQPFRSQTIVMRTTD